MLIVVLRFPYVCILKHNSKSQTSVAYVVSSRYKMLAMQSVDADGRTRTCVLRVELLKYSELEMQNVMPQSLNGNFNVLIRPVFFAKQQSQQLRCLYSICCRPI